MTPERARYLLTTFMRPYSYRPARQIVVVEELLTAGAPLEAFYRWMMYVAVQGMTRRVPLPVTHWDVVGVPSCSQPFDPEDCRLHLRLAVSGAHVVLFPGMVPPANAAVRIVRFEVKAERRRSAVRAEVSEEGRGLFFQATGSLTGNGVNAFRVDGWQPAASARTPAAAAPRAP
jgi:hypothetical protein